MLFMSDADIVDPGNFFVGRESAVFWHPVISFRRGEAIASPILFLAGIVDPGDFFVGRESAVFWHPVISFRRGEASLRPFSSCS